MVLSILLLTPLPVSKRCPGTGAAPAAAVFVYCASVEITNSSCASRRFPCASRNFSCASRNFQRGQSGPARSCVGKSKKSFTHLGQHRLYARNVLTHLRKLIGLRRLSGRPGHPQIELFTAQLEKLLAEILRRLGAQIFGLHVRTCRLTNAVDTDSLAEASRNASRALA